MGASRALNHAEMDKVRTGLRTLGFEVARLRNEFSISLPGEITQVFDALLAEGIIVHYIDECCGYAIGLPEENQSVPERACGRDARRSIRKARRGSAIITGSLTRRSGKSTTLSTGFAELGLEVAYFCWPGATEGRGDRRSYPAQSAVDRIARGRKCSV